MKISKPASRQAVTISKDGFKLDGGGHGEIRVELSHDNRGSCLCYMPNVFSISAVFYRDNVYWAPATDEDIINYIPDLEGCLKWRGMTSEGPADYIQNVMYLAGDKDRSGTAVGEPLGYRDVVFLGDSPVPHEIPESLMEFIHTAPKDHVYEVVMSLHEDQGMYRPKFTIKGLDEDWYKCPWDHEYQAQSWCDAMNHPYLYMQTKRVVCKVSYGKAPDLKAARVLAVWPDATLEQLTDEKVLSERLPGLIEEFATCIDEHGLVF